jgi:hypothetical protein
MPKKLFILHMPLAAEVEIPPNCPSGREKEYAYAKIKRALLEVSGKDGLGRVELRRPTKKGTA